MGDSLVLVGTGDSLGVPRVYCDCEVCTEARRTGLNRRTRPSAVVRAGAGEPRDLWIDCGPDWRAQMEALGLRGISTVLLTHGHHDHIGGIPELADMARWTREPGQRHPVQVFGPPATLEVVRSRYPWVERSLELVPLRGPVELLGYRIETWEVCHGRNGRSYAYRFNGPGGSWAYCPDSIALNEAERAPLRGLDLLVLGTAYHHEEAPFESRSIYDMREAVTLLEDVRPRRAVFTHLSHGVDRRRRYPLPPEVTVGHDGLVVVLP